MASATPDHHYTHLPLVLHGSSAVGGTHPNLGSQGHGPATPSLVSLWLSVVTCWPLQRPSHCKLKVYFFNVLSPALGDQGEEKRVGEP